MQRIDQAQLNNALTTTGAQLQKHLPNAEFQELAVLVQQTIERYPSQDLADSMSGYLHDLENLCLKYSLRSVKDALWELRTKPGQTFFPRPDEVAGEIEDQIERGRVARDAALRAAKRVREIAEFWQWAPQWMEDTGNDEEELLRRFPSYRGTEPSLDRARPNVVSMTRRSGKAAAEANGDEAV